jgi:glycosyltransferase involved in cell wall biosynthesis
VKLSCVILTMGDRPAELARAIGSAVAQQGDGLEVVAVGNGADVGPVPPGVKVVKLPENLGVAGGRNAGVEACGGDVVLFLDDDGWFPDPQLGPHVARRFAADPGLAVISFRVADPEGGPGARWHVPRLRAGDPERSSPVTTFAWGACAVRRAAYVEAGGLPEAFFYAPDRGARAVGHRGAGLGGGVQAGWRMDPGWRRPMSARTAWRMTRAGRPPVI